MQARSCLGLTGIITHHGMYFTGLELVTGSHIVPYFKENNCPGSKLENIVNKGVNLHI